jgi:hypothetical protein
MQAECLLPDACSPLAKQRSALALRVLECYNVLDM